jgi:hypothetical protein
MNVTLRQELPPRPISALPLSRTANERIATLLSLVLALTALIAAAASFFGWRLFVRDAPMTVGNMRGTALTVMAVALPTLLIAMFFAARGSLRAKFVWLGVLAYLSYNAVLFSFSVHFNSFFLLYTSFLCLSFWALLTRVATLNLAEISVATGRVPVRTIAVYLFVSAAAFCALWLLAIVPATIDNSFPAALAQAGLTQNAVWVLDFAFTFPLMVLGAVWMWKRLPWGYIISAMMVIMLTIETISIGIDQWFGQLHDPTASAAAVPAMVVFSVAGAAFSWLFLSRMTD